MSLPFMITSRQAFETVVGLTQASSVIARVNWSEFESGIVTREQLTKEREAIAKAREALIKGEAEARAKLAEAQLKEADAESKKLAAEAARREQDARGPLREETIRLSYADPEEVAKTLQGILGIPATGQKVEGLGVISSPIAGPIAEPPFSQLFGPPGAYPPPPPSLVSVSQDVLTKGLTIRAYKPANTLVLRLYQTDLERVKKWVVDDLGSGISALPEAEPLRELGDYLWHASARIKEIRRA